MMERRRVLTIPFCVEKDHQSETPLKIPINCLSPECRKLEGQIPWTAFADCKNISHNSQHKNGSVIFDRSPAAVITVEMTRKKPILVLTDVLKTDLGKDYIERVKMSGTICLRGRPKDPRKERDRCREEPQTCRNTRSTQREANNNIGSESLTPKRDLKTTSTVFQRKRLKRKLQNDEDEHKEESQDTEEMIRGKDSKKEERLEVLDCELSTATSCDAFPSDDIKGRFTSPKKHEQQKRKKKIFGSQCNGTSGCKRHCESFLHLSVEDGKEGGQVSSSEEENHGKQSPRSVNMEDSEYNVDLENMDRCILQFTVGGDDGTEALVPVITPLLEAEDNINITRQKSSSRQDSMTQTCPSEPIVLSSDDEEGSGSSQCSREATQTVAETVRQRKSSQEAVSKQEEVSDTQMMELLVEASPSSSPASPVPEVDYSCLSVPFSVLHCGGYQARASGGLMIAEHKIIIPLEDTSTQERILSFERKELRKYSIWDQQELEEWGFHINGEGASPCVLLFYVSETAAAAIQRDLCQLCVKEEESINTEKASPFILLTLKDPLDGMEGALLRSMLDIDCINSMTLKQTLSAQDDRIDFSSPVLSLDNCVELIRRTGLDSHLLSMLSMRSTSSEQRTDQDSSNYDEDEIPTAHIWLDADFQNEPDQEQDQDQDHDTAPEEDTETQIKLKEDPKEEKQENSSDNKKEEAQSVYTVCHRRTKGSYSVSLSKPDSKWIKYKHRGVARRLIQFPPPPLKGGITVTMENLQCLDSGQYLNDVIIDFYLKYLIQNVPAALAERCHIFSSFFYKQLTRRDNASEGGNSDSCQRQRRHQRVKTWTRHVDIFEKDFLFVPVNQEAHWYLVVICFPGLEEMKLEDWTGDTEDQDEAPGCKSSKDNTETPVALKRSDSPDPETEKNREESTKDSTPCPVSCTEQTCQKKTVCKRPCILIMDSLKVSLHERVFKLLREYLQSEWEARRGSSRDFGPDQMKSSHCKVPLQDNSSDCGLYLLQYVECFLKDPVVHFDLPLLLQKWFPRQVIRKKRDEIRDLILNLYRHQNLENE